MPLKLPALDPAALAPRAGSSLPEHFRVRMFPRETRALGTALGLTKLGINLTVLPPGKESSLRHFHTHEDEFVFLLEGELVLRSDESEQVLTAGMCAGFAGGIASAHQFVNRGQASAIYLELSNRDRADRAEYPDDDLAWGWTADGKPTVDIDNSSRQGSQVEHNSPG